MTELVIPKQTAATSQTVLIDMSPREINGVKKYPFPCTFVSNGLTGTEVIDIMISDDGVNYAPMLNRSSGLAEQLTATSNTFSINVPCNLRFDKTLTTGLVGVGISTVITA